MNFDRLAPHYDWMEALTAGNRLQQARTVWLDELRGRRRILTLGEGHGRFAAACAARFPEAEITVVEASPRMLARAQARTRRIPAHFTWHCADVFNWQPTGTYDAIVTCFFLDCFPPAMLASVVAKLGACATDNAAWLLVDFTLPPRGLARWRAQAVHALMYAFFRRAVALPAHRMTPPGDLLRAQGFHLRQKRDFNWGLVGAELWQRGLAAETHPSTPADRAGN